jgi:hypothetical protein
MCPVVLLHGGQCATIILYFSSVLARRRPFIAQNGGGGTAHKRAREDPVDQPALPFVRHRCRYSSGRRAADGRLLHSLGGTPSNDHSAMDGLTRCALGRRPHRKRVARDIGNDARTRNVVPRCSSFWTAPNRFRRAMISRTSIMKDRHPLPRWPTTLPSGRQLKSDQSHHQTLYRFGRVAANAAHRRARPRLQ